jgi:hypothetical protein
MPIRKRGPSWQVDVRLPDGKRYRKTVNTEAEAVVLEATLYVNPAKRRAIKRASRLSPGATKQSVAHSSEPSKPLQVEGQPQASIPETSPTSVVAWPHYPSVIDTSAKPD